MPSTKPTANATQFALDLMQDSVLWVNKMGIIENTNKATCQLLGYHQLELIGLPLEAVDPKLSNEIWKKHWEHIKKEQTTSIDAEHFSKTGKRIPVRVHAHFVNFEQQEYIFLRATNLTNTKRYQQLFELAEKVTKTGAFDWHLETNALLYTKEINQIFDLAPKELMSFETCMNCFEQKDVQQLRKGLVKTRNEKIPLTATLKLTSLKGNKKTIYLSARPKSFNNKVIKLQGVLQDITAKKEAEEIIQLTYHTMNQAKDIILWAKLDGTLLYFNDAITAQLGYSREEFKHFKSRDLIVNYDKALGTTYKKALQDRKTYTGEKTLLKKDKTHLLTELKSSVILYEGEEIICSIFRDITDRKEKEQKLHAISEENKQLKEALQAENIYLQEEIKLNHNFNEIITISLNYSKVLGKIEEVASTNATVLVTGETGTGKELIARAIHQLSERSKRPLIKINCATLPTNLIESELFGHEKGAFTGAIHRKIGRFELANKATLFLDEIGEMPLSLQAKLLRVLQEGEFSRLGSNETLKTDVRIIAATNRNLLDMIKQGSFRKDLYYRLNVFPIHNIPLRERKEDIPVLVKYFIDKFSQRTGRKVYKVSARSMNKLKSYTYPGNIRELENIIERAVIVSKTETLDLSQWNPKTNQNLISKEEEFLSFEAIQKAHILKALKKTSWKVSGTNSAAELLALNAKTLESKMRKFGIKRKDFMM